MKQIYNINEHALFYQLMPAKLSIFNSCLDLNIDLIVMTETELTIRAQQFLQQILKSWDPSTVLHSAPLKLLMIQRQQHFYLSDGLIIIQCLLQSNHSTKNEKGFPPAFNLIRTQFYNFQARISHVFMFSKRQYQQYQARKKQRSETKYLPSVYQPLFHFAEERIEKYYQQERDKTLMRLSQCTEAIIIKQWYFQLVNVANTGYYGIVIHAQNYERTRQKYSLSQELHCILYHKKIAEMLQKIRLKKIRQITQPPKSDYKISLCFYMKNIKAAKSSKSHHSCFVSVDKVGKYLNVKSQLKQSYVPLGNMNGLYRFLRPFNNYSQNKRGIIYFNLFKPKITKFSPMQQKQTEVISSDSQQSQSEDAWQIEEVDSESQNQSEEYQEPLKLIYLKQMQNMTFI